MIKTRNYITDIDKKEETYKGNKIIAWKTSWEELDETKDKWNKKSKITCHLHREFFLSLGECDDGSPFTAVNQAVNVAKSLCNYDDEREIEEKLRNIGFKNEDFFEYNSLKDIERIRIKQELFEQHNLKQ
jgi:hypothetical protein